MRGTALIIVLLLIGCAQAPPLAPVPRVVVVEPDTTDHNLPRYGTWDGMVYGPGDRDWPLRIRLDPDSTWVWRAYESVWHLPDSLGWGDQPLPVLSCAGTDPRLILTLELEGWQGIAELSGLREGDSMVGAYRDGQGDGMWVVRRSIPVP